MKTDETYGNIDIQEEYTESQKEELEMEESKSWTSYITKVVICLKCLVVTLVLL